MLSTDTDRKRTIRNLIIFTVVVLASGWLGYGLDRVMNNPPDQRLGMLLWLVLPLITALLLRAFGGDGWRDFGLWPNLRGNWQWYAASLLIYPLTAVFVLGIGALLGLVSAPSFNLGLLLTVVAGGLVGAFIKNIFEEFAWRGYLAPKVYGLGLDNYLGHIIVGVIWGAWHIPYLLFMLDRSVVAATTTQSMATFVPMAIISLAGASIVYGELRLLTDSLWPALLLHTVGNALVDVLVVQGFVRLAPGSDWLVSPGHQSLLTLVAFVAVGVALHRARRQRERGSV